MAEPTGFLQHSRESVVCRPVAQRIADWREVELPIAPEQAQRQATRCMDCGVPYCHAFGCPLRNRIPEFSDLVRRGRWREASDNLHSTNNFPEFTGRTCPAPCEPACTLAINDAPVTIKNLENAIVERAWAEGWITPQPPPRETGQRVAVVGSGPAGLAAAQQIRRAGHHVTVFELADRIGGLLRYGIPDFKLDKAVLDRRLAQLSAEGVAFQTNVRVGVDLSVAYLQKMFSAVVLAIGATVPRDLDVPGRRDARNVHFALDYLEQQNRINAGDALDPLLRIDARDRIVAVIGGGDTGSDCVGTAVRQGARAVHQLEILPEPPSGSNPATPWPLWPQIQRTGSSHEEGCQRRWSVTTRHFTVRDNFVHELTGCAVDWVSGADSRAQAVEIPGTEFGLPVDLVVLAMGFVHAAHGGLVESLGLKLDGRGGIAADPQGMTSVEGVFACGDAVSGPSLVVRALAAGRTVADAVDAWLSGPRSTLPAACHARSAR